MLGASHGSFINSDPVASFNKNDGRAICASKCILSFVKTCIYLVQY
jgi:hypothetical protein